MNEVFDNISLAIDAVAASKDPIEVGGGALKFLDDEDGTNLYLRCMRAGPLPDDARG